MKENKIASLCRALKKGALFFLPLLLTLSSCQSESNLESVLSAQSQPYRVVSTPTLFHELPRETLPVEEEASETEFQEKIPLEHSLMLPQAGRVYHGVWLPVQEELDVEKIDAFQQQTAMPLDSVIYYLSWGEQDWDWCERQLRIAARESLLLHVVWEPWLPENENALQTIVDGQMDEHIRRFAAAAASYGSPFFLRFAHEMNGDWYPWSGEHCGQDPALYIDAWRHVWTLFEEEGAVNVIWVWAPNYQSVPNESWNEVWQYYPGEAYVDWVGVDFYGLKWTDDFPEHMLDEIYTLYSRSHPIMIAETAASDPANSLQGISIGKPLWINRLFSMLPLYPQVKAVYWFNEKKEADWRVQSEPYPEALNAYIEGWQKLNGR